MKLPSKTLTLRKEKSETSDNRYNHLGLHLGAATSAVPLSKRQLRAKKKLDVAQGKLGNVGWWTSGVKSFGKMFKALRDFVFPFKMSKDQVATMGQAADIISYGKTGLGWLRNTIISIYNILQIKERWNNPEKRFGNFVRGANVAANSAFMGFDISLLVGVGNATPFVIIISSALNIVVKVLFLIKNGIAQAKGRLQFNQLNRWAPDRDNKSVEAQKERNAIKELQYKQKRRKIRMGTRGVSLGFGLLSLGVVLVATLTGNPMVFAALVIIGVANLAIGKVLRYLRYKKLNQYRLEMGLKPKLHYMSMAQLKQHQECLQQKVDRSSKYASDYDELSSDLRDANFQITKNRWENRMMVFDMVMAGGMIAFGVAAVVTANPLLFIGAAVLFVGLLVGKVIMTRQMNKELKLINPGAFEDNGGNIEMTEVKQQEPQFNLANELSKPKQLNGAEVQTTNAQETSPWKKDQKIPKLSRQNFHSRYAYEGDDTDDISMVPLSDDNDDHAPNTFSL